MKTKTQSVTMIVRDETGRERNISVSISDRGNLMTHRLSQLLAGRVYLARRGCNDRDEAELVGFIWQPPYTLLQEIVDEVSALEKRLRVLVDTKYSGSGTPAGVGGKKSSLGLERELGCASAEEIVEVFADDSRRNAPRNAAINRNEAVTNAIASGLAIRSHLKELIQTLEKGRKPNA